MAPQLIFLALTCMSLAAYLFGFKPKDDNSAGAMLGTTLFLTGLYWWGGFYDAVYWPQIAMVVMQAVWVGRAVAEEHGGDPRKLPKTLRIVLWPMTPALLYFGNFFAPLGLTFPR